MRSGATVCHTRSVGSYTTLQSFAKARRTMSVSSPKECFGPTGPSVGSNPPRDSRTARRNPMFPPHTAGRFRTTPLKTRASSKSIRPRFCCASSFLANQLGGGASHFSRMRPPTASASHCATARAAEATQEGLGRTSSSVKSRKSLDVREMPALSARLLPALASKQYWTGVRVVLANSSTTFGVWSRELLSTTRTSHCSPGGTAWAPNALRVARRLSARLYVGTTTVKSLSGMTVVVLGLAVMSRPLFGMRAAPHQDEQSAHARLFGWFQRCRLARNQESREGHTPGKGGRAQIELSQAFFESHLSREALSPPSNGR